MKNPKTVTKEDIERRNAEFDAAEASKIDQEKERKAIRSGSKMGIVSPTMAADQLVESFANERRTEINTSVPGMADIRVNTLERSIWSLLDRVDKSERSHSDLGLTVGALVERVERLEGLFYQSKPTYQAKPSPDIKWTTADEFRSAEEKWQVDGSDTRTFYELCEDLVRSQIEPQLKGDK
jgi:hypothetical protein